MYTNQANVMISTDPNGQGGVASVVNTMLAQPFAKSWNIQQIVSHRAGTKFTMLLVFLQAILKLIFIRMKSNPGIAHIHMSSRGSFSRKFLLAKIAKFLGFKIIIHLHGAQFDRFYEGECSTLKQQKVQKLFERADAVIVLGQRWKRWILETFPNVHNVHNVKIIYNPGPSKVVERSPATIPTILFLGRLGERKGVSDLLNALPAVIEQVSGLRVVFGGDGDIEHYRQLAKSLNIDSTTNFMGWIGSVEKFMLLASASVFVLPSYNEGFPVGIIEAMACEVPVIATTVGGIPDAISHGLEGLLVNAGDTAALSQALIEILNDPCLAKRLSDSAKQKYIQNFSCEAIMPLWHQLYMDISNG